jgi:hypothetical protein
VFLATGITEGQHEREHEEQDMHSAWFSRGELEQMIVDGEITDAQSIAAWALFLLVPQACPERGEATTTQDQLSGETSPRPDRSN